MPKKVLFFYMNNTNKIRFGISLILFVFLSLLQPNLQLYAEDTCDFTLMTIEGEKIQLKDYRGKKIVHLVFWSTWCPKCLMDISKLKKFWDTIGTKPYEILAVNVCLNESQERIKKIKKKYQMPFKIVLDEKGKVARNFGVISIPCHIIIDKEGVIKDRFSELPKDTANFFNKIFSGMK